MDYKIFNFNLDLGRESRNAIKPVQGESAVKLRPTLTHNSQPFNLTDCDVRCLFRKPDMTYSYIDGVIIDAAKGIVEIALTNQVLLLSGSVVGLIEVTGAIGIARTWLFTMDVQPGMPLTDVISMDEFPAVEQMLIDVADIKANFNAVVAGVTVDGEVILARGVFTTLQERLDAKEAEFSAQLGEIDQRVDTIITTPVPTGEVIAQEIIDARDGEVSVGAKVRSISTDLAQKTQEMDAIVANVTVDSEVILARGTDTTLKNRLDKSELKLDNIAIKPFVKGLKSKNLFDDTDVNVGFYVAANGTLQPYATYIASNYIKVLPSTPYIANINQSGAWYDANKTFISAFSDSRVMGTSPANAAYVRFSMLTTSTKIQLEQNTVSTAYQSFNPTLTPVKTIFTGLANILMVNDSVYQSLINISGFKLSITQSIAQPVVSNLYLRKAGRVNTGLAWNFTTNNIEFIFSTIIGGVVVDVARASSFSNIAGLPEALQLYSIVGVGSYVASGNMIVPQSVFTELCVKQYANSVASELVRGYEVDKGLISTYFSDPIPMDTSYFDLAYIKNRRLVANYNPNPLANTAKYTGIDIGAGKKPTSIRCKAIFEPGTNTSSIALISNPNGLLSIANILTKSVHIVFTATSIAADLLLSSGETTPLLHRAYTTPCVKDGVTEYSFGWRIAGNTITFEFPDGTTESVTNALIPEYLGQYCTIEHYWNKPSDVARSLYTYFEILGIGVKVVDFFKRNDGAIGNAPTGQTYVQINETNQYS